MKINEKYIATLPICPFCVLGPGTHCDGGIPYKAGNYNTVINGEEQAPCRAAWINERCLRLTPGDVQ